MSPKSHHFNPQVYLRQFTNPASRKDLWQYDLRQGTVSRSSPKASGCEDFYHSFELKDDGRDDASLEQSFHSIENKLPKLFETLRHKRPLLEDNWLTLFLFAALQRTRCPKALRSTQDGLSKVYQHAYEIMKHSPSFSASMKEKGLDPEAIRKADISVTADRGTTLLTLLAANADGSLVKTFNRMKWTFLVAPPGHYFYTSDDPVCCWADRDPKSPFHAAVGPANSDAEVTLPLSRRACAFASWSKKSSTLYTDASSGQVEAVNYRTAMNGFHFLYGPTNDSALLSLVKRRAEIRQQPPPPKP
jgi:hypothetical protein